MAEAYEMMLKIYLRNLVTLRELLQAERDVLNADLDLLDNPEDRMKALQNHKLFVDKIVKMIERKAENGMALKYEVLQAKSYALQIQIDILKETKKQTAKAGNKRNN